jgi:penicillin-binding protein 2
MIAGIGQGYMKSSNVQLCKMMAQFANGGYKISPSFIEKEETVLTEKIINDDEHVELLLKSLDAATNEPGGTSYASRIIGSTKFAGKTGTAQVRRISQLERDQDIKNKDLPWKYRDHSLFVGFGPTDKPKYAITVIIDHGGSGSAVAAPIARDVMKKIFEKDAKVNNV